MQNTNFKKVIAYVNALIGTAAYTFPTAFTVTPDYWIGANASGTTVSAISTSAVTITGVGGSGFIMLEGY